MLFKKTILGTILGLFLTGCGFSPVYWQDGTDFLEKTAQVSIAPIPEYSGRILTQALKDNLNPKNIDAPKNYTLTVKINETIDKDQGVLGDKTSTRATFYLKAFYFLKAGDKELLSSIASATSSYNILPDPYSTVTAEQAVRERLLKILANDISVQITAYFKHEEASQKKADK